MALAEALRLDESSLLSPKSAGRFLSQMGFLDGIWIYPFALVFAGIVPLFGLRQLKPALVFEEYHRLRERVHIIVMVGHRELGHLLEEGLRPAHSLPPVFAALWDPKEAHLQRWARLMGAADLVGHARIVSHRRHPRLPKILQQRLAGGFGFHQDAVSPPGGAKAVLYCGAAVLC